MTNEIEISQEQIDWAVKMKEEALSECSNCGVDISTLHFTEISPMMMHVSRERCIPCHNKWIAGLDEFYKEYEFALPDDTVSISTSEPVGKGWMDDIKSCITELNEKYPEVEVVQIKEKFGQLRIYVDIPEQQREHYDDIYSIIGNWTEKTNTKCEFCGDSGVMSGAKEGFRWIKTLCSKHQEETNRVPMSMEEQ